MTAVDECVFCAIVAGRASATIVGRWSDALTFTPRRGGVVPGHMLIVPRVHVADAVEDPMVTAATMARAAEYAGTVGPCNIITSVGREATQTVFHLHIHVLPRRAGDGVMLPWPG